ncbi:seryl-tRNA synthetase [Acidimicrobium ferrooxidans DSM 10331]|uniref:Serine--tRNA ligase n=1 Tax=Acidimicrobium ferrooxidans (strain DSM 10331 / JCM 15462 / NBRC 103882 / ICP) TaxID=525909 RepID=C7M261_ACIFD|nr:serine--tRNA ligase [Acidimicrobium ferrooxidans]ACU53159.1 seryl-tRNA synthetase [Acidimicrobium ferrooxidans DSM 10331]
MIDLTELRAHPDDVARRLASRGIDPEVVAHLATIDQQLRAVITERDQLRAELRARSRDIAEARRSGRDATELQEGARALGNRLDELEQRVDTLTGDRDAIWLTLPNIPSPNAPIGEDEHDNRVVRQWSPETGTVEPDVDLTSTTPSHRRVPHFEIGRELGILDLERAAKLSGSMFALYRNLGARLVRALTNFALDAHAEAFEEIHPPTLVRRETMVATGHLPKFADDAYVMERDDLYAIPTAEVPLTSLYRDEILDLAMLPMRLTAATPCYRREAGSAGRDTRGLLRLHEFDKVEILALVAPEDATSMHLELLGRAEALLQRLGLIYRVVDLCTGDLGQSSARTFDLEVYAPGVDAWLEVSSVSWFSDYQARRANVRFRREPAARPEYVHTLNGSALAWPRVIAALLEQGREPDGSIRLPDALAPYLGTSRLEAPKTA